MKYKPKIAVLGGDLRQYATAKELSQQDIEVVACALCVEKSDTERIKTCEDIAEAIADSRAVILPLPTSIDGTVLNCPVASS